MAVNWLKEMFWKENNHPLRPGLPFGFVFWEANLELRVSAHSFGDSGLMTPGELNVDGDCCFF